MTEIPLAGWNRLISEHPEAHLLQTGEWGELKRDFGWEPVRVESGGTCAQVLFRRLPLGYSVAYIPKGPLLPALQDAPLPDQIRGFWDEVNDACRARKAVFLKVEPDAWEPVKTTYLEGSPGFSVSQHSIQPRRTILIDLRGSEQDILDRMKQKCRYNIRLAEKKDVNVRVWEDVDAFHRMMTLTGARNEFGVHSLKYYQRAHDLLVGSGLGTLLVSEFQGKPLASLMVCVRGKYAWYLYGASTDEERNRMPAYLLQWEAMRWARNRQADWYDLWGVPDLDEAALEAGFESRNDGLWGVYRFKRGFGGIVMRSHAPYDRVYHPLLYQAYLLTRSGRE